MSKRLGDQGYAAGWCIHYRYNRNLPAGAPDTCEAGVDYGQWRGTKFDVRPCFLDKSGQSKPGTVQCPKIRRPTPDEIAAHETWVKACLNRMEAVMAGIADWRKAHKGRSASEVVECPACKGRLHLSISAHNGHVHGKCETKGCVSWME